MATVLYQYRFVFVVALLVAAVMLLSDPDRLPLALRGLRKVLGAPAANARPSPVTRTRRIVAFLLVAAAFGLVVL